MEVIDVLAARGVTASDPPAVQAFDAIAASFDERFGEWASVAAQRRAVRRALLRVFPPGASLLELGGGTGEDALFLAAHGRCVLVTDGARSMLECAERKADAAGLSHRIRTRRVLLERLDELAAASAPFDGVFSNFAALNCVTDLNAVARSLAPLLARGSAAVLVMFGPCAPGEVVVQLLRRNPSAAVRRLSRGAVLARLAGRNFTVRYPSPRTVARSFSPWFELVRTLGIGVFVPPSAAEPAISRNPRVLAALEAMDRVIASPLAWLGDHALLEFRRTDAGPPGKRSP